MRFPFPNSSARVRAFTMVELALCIAIVGIAMVAIIGVLPVGINVQRENRDESVINQDAQFLLEAIRSGSANLTDLTNYVDVIQVASMNNLNRITNIYTGYHVARSLPDYTPSTGSQGRIFNVPFGIVNGTNIIGLLSLPKVFRDGSIVFTNQVSAIVRAMNGPASEKPRRDAVESDEAKLDLAFKYRVTSEVTPFNVFPANQDFRNNGSVATWRHLTTNLYNITLTFEWPVFVVNDQLRIGSGRKVFRTQVSGRLEAASKRDTPAGWFMPPHFFRTDRYTIANINP